MIKQFTFLIIAATILFIHTPVNAQVFQDYRSDYRTIPVYNKTVQFFIGREKNQTVLYFKQNLGFSEDSQAFIIPIQGDDSQVELVNKTDPINDFLDIYELPFSYALKKVDYKIIPKIYSVSEKDKLFEILRTENIAITDIQRTQINSWFQNDLNILLLVTDPVKESRITWTTPVKITSKQNELSLPVGWLRSDFGALTTNAGKVIYAENFEGGNGGWRDEFQGAQANSLVTRDDNQAYQGGYSLKVANKAGSINAITTQTIGGLTPDEHYTFSAYFKNGTATQGYAVLRVMGDGLVAMTSGVPLYDAQSKQWQRISVPFQARSAFHFFSLMASGNPNEYVYWDNIQIEKGIEATAFRNDLVGTITQTVNREDLSTTNVNVQVLLFGNDVFSVSGQLFKDTVYKFSDKNFIKLFSDMQIKYATQLQGTINPQEISQFITVNTVDSKSIQTETLFPRKKDGKIIAGIETYLTSNLFIFAILGIALLLKYVTFYLLLFKKQFKAEKTVFPLFLYGGSWFINVLSMVFLVTSLYAQMMLPQLINNSFFRNNIFLISLFLTSLLVYLLTLLSIRNTKINILTAFFKGQLSICIFILLIVISLFFSDLQYGSRLNQVPTVTIILLEMTSFIVGLRIFVRRKH